MTFKWFHKTLRGLMVSLALTLAVMSTAADAASLQRTNYKVLCGTHQVIFDILEKHNSRLVVSGQNFGENIMQGYIDEDGIFVMVVILTGEDRACLLDAIEDAEWSVENIVGGQGEPL